MNTKGADDVTFITLQGENSSHHEFNMTGFTNISMHPEQSSGIYVSEGDLKFREIVNTMDVYWIPIIFVLGRYAGFLHVFFLLVLGLLLHGGHQGS